jgi:hypothetical protein
MDENAKLCSPCLARQRLRWSWWTDWKDGCCCLPCSAGFASRASIRYSELAAR